MKIYVVSGFYYFNDNAFELDEMPQSVHISLEEANNTCEKEFNNYKTSIDYTDEECIEVGEDGTKCCTVYNDENGERVIIGVTAYEIDVEPKKQKNKITVSRIIETTYEDGTYWIEYTIGTENESDFRLGYDITDTINKNTDIKKLEENINNNPTLVDKYLDKEDVDVICSEWLISLIDECRGSENEMWYFDYDEMEEEGITHHDLDKLKQEIKNLGIEKYVEVDNGEYAVLVYGGVITQFLF